MVVIKSIFYRLYALFINFNRNKIKIGRSVLISKDTLLHKNVVVLDYSRIFKSEISSYSYISPFSIIIDTFIGKYCSIGPGCRIGLGKHPLYGISTSPYFYNDNLFKKKNDSDFSPVKIGNDVWVGANVLIMGGVTIGDGCVIGAGSVVTKDLEPYSIAIGVPAKIMKKRFSEKVINSLLESKWWDCEHHELMSNKNLFNNIDVFLARVK